jgi:hypothetical protein
MTDDLSMSVGVPCPKCGELDAFVMDSRPTLRSAIRRRRECKGCRFRFTTYERLAEAGEGRDGQLRIARAKQQLDALIRLIQRQYAR